ncbi:MAG: amino acid adenylation domain-containing protein [Pseudomonadota bacterium]
MQSQPDRCAVEYGSERLSYADLWQHSGEVARHLKRQGLGGGSVVGLCLERGISAAVGLLGILRSGAAYLPLDPTFPTGRLSYMLKRAKVTRVLTEAKFASLFGDRALLISIRAPGAERVRCALEDSDPAYVIFTSGSTGNPKGVVLSHGNLGRLIEWQCVHSELGELGRVLQFAPLGFDVHFQEFFGAWCTGGTLVMIDDERRRDPQQLLRFMEAEALTTLFLPFVALQQLVLAAHDTGSLPALRNVVTAGEQLVVDERMRTFFADRPQVRLHNHYGPSETHVATTHTLPANPSCWETLPSIGRPINGSRALLMGADAAPITAIGETGELWLGGACVGQGYIGAPELTQERFVDREDLGGRFFRTGDLARWRTDGALDYEGRLDDQLKIRGHRVELGEIEAVLRQLSGVENAVVSARQSSGGERQLIAYLVPAVDPPVAHRGSNDPHWREIWDRTYEGSFGTQNSGTGGGDEDFSGWNSSFTGEALDPESMRVWVDETRKRILQLNPNRVLELGAGTGLILCAVAPHVADYYATDFSPVAVRALEQRIASVPALAERARCAVMAAHDVDRVSDQADTIVINSVTQHLESGENLQQLIERCLAHLPSDGSLFVGDVTARMTRALFFAAVEAHRTRGEVSDEQFAHRVEKRLADDQDLVLDPWYLATAVAELMPGSNFETRLKSGNYKNELIEFRYDVWIRCQDSAITTDSVGQAYRHEFGSDTDLDNLIANGPLPMRIERIPNARLHRYRDAYHRVQPERAAAKENPTVDPDTVHRLADQRGIAASTFFDGADTFCAVLSSEPLSPAAWLSVSGTEARSDGASRPYLTANFGDLVASVRSQLKSALPAYMQPSRYVLLRSLPVLPSGKLDRRRLPKPSTERPTVATEFVAPRNTLEETLAGLWAAQLELDQVGIDDNFFELGGTSISSLRITHSMMEHLNLELSIVELFKNPTIRSFAAALELKTGVGEGGVRGSSPSSSTDVATDRARRTREALKKARTRRARK